MNKTRKLIGIALLGLWCLSLPVSTLQAVSPAKLREVTAEEVQKIEKAMPRRATVRVSRPRKLLVFWRCEGFYHKSIPVGNKALELMGQKTGAFDVVITDDYSVFTTQKLEQFDAVCLNNTTGLKFDPKEIPERCKALMDFVKSGKGIVGIHAATDNFNQWPEAREMMGGKFTGHPWGSGGTWAIKIDEPDHPLMKAFKGKGFKIKDEIYRTDPPLYSRDKQLVLMSLDMSDPTTKAKASKPTDADTGISWVKRWGKGRIFYCSLGHNDHIFWNPAVLQHYLDGIQFALGDLEVDTKPRPMISTGKGLEMDELLEKVKTYDYGQSRMVLTEVSDLVRKAYGSPAELRRIEKSLLEVLRSDATPAAKQFICRKLSLIGTSACVPTLAAMLTQKPASKAAPHPADMARYALERIPGAAVDEALRNALRKTTGTPKVGIINSLGQRRDSKSVRALRRLIYDSDHTTAAAAVAALGEIAGSGATKALAQARNKTTGKLRVLVLDAYLKCADRLTAEGKKAQALAIYRELVKEGQPEPIRAAALRGIFNVTMKGKK